MTPKASSGASVVVADGTYLTGICITLVPADVVDSSRDCLRWRIGVNPIFPPHGEITSPFSSREWLVGSHLDMYSSFGVSVTHKYISGPG